MKERFAFPKNEKLTGETTVNELFIKGRSMIVYPMRIVWSFSPAAEMSSLKTLMSVPKKKLKHAVDRNKVKRLLRESFRLHKRELATYIAEHCYHVQVAFVWIPNEVLDFAKVERKMVDALQKMMIQIQQEQQTAMNPKDD